MSQYERMRRARNGDPVEPRDFNEIREELERLNKFSVAAPLGFSNGPDGPKLWWGGNDGNGLKWSLTGSGGIPKRTGSTPGSAQVTPQDWDSAAGTFTAWSSTVKCLNMATSAAVGGSKYILMAFVDGDWWAVWEDC